MLSKRQRLPIAEFFGPKAPKPRNIFRSRYFSLKIYDTTRLYSRFGVVLSKKIADKASARNRLKRIAFRVFQNYLNRLPVADYLCLPVSVASAASRIELESDLFKLVNPLILDSRF